MDLGELYLEYVGLPLALGLGGFAVWRGGQPERLAVAIVLTGWLAKPLLQIDPQPAFPILAGSIQTIVLFLISERFRRIWTMLIMACSAAGVAWRLGQVFVPSVQALPPIFFEGTDFLSGVTVALCFGLAAWESRFFHNNSDVGRD